MKCNVLMQRTNVLFLMHRVSLAVILKQCAVSERSNLMLREQNFSPFWTNQMIFLDQYFSVLTELVTWVWWLNVLHIKTFIMTDELRWHQVTASAAQWCQRGFIKTRFAVEFAISPTATELESRERRMTAPPHSYRKHKFNFATEK